MRLHDPHDATRSVYVRAIHMQDHDPRTPKPLPYVWERTRDAGYTIRKLEIAITCSGRSTSDAHRRTLAARRMRLIKWQNLIRALL